MMTTWKCFLPLLILCGACGEPAPRPAMAPAWNKAPAPAIWKIKDADTTVYLLGTVHVLAPGVAWRSPAISNAFRQARAIYFETDTEGDPLALREITDRLGYYGPSERLSDHLAANDLVQLKSALARLDLPLVTLETMRPWYAGVVISQTLVLKAGYDAASGVETILRAQAQTDGKELRFLETMEEQMLSFASLPEDVQVRFLMNDITDIDGAAQKLDKLIRAWTAGDVGRLETLLIDEDLSTLPQLYDALLTNRNVRWAPEIDTLMRSEPGTFLIAVGAAHLLGKDSVLELLKKRGYIAERVSSAS